MYGAAMLAQQPTPHEIGMFDMVKVVWGIFTASPWITAFFVIILLIGMAIPTTKKVSGRRKRRREAYRATVGALVDDEPSPIEPVSQTGPAPLGGFRSCVGLLTPTEAGFYKVLCRAVGAERQDGPRVMVKVRLADLVLPTAAFRSGAWQADFNRVARKHVDFVVVAGDRMVPLRVVELDDASHDRVDRAERDDLVDEILRRAGVPVTHVRVGDGVDEAAMRKMLAGATATHRSA